MNKPISDSIRKEVGERAKYCCEYCHVSEEDMYFSPEVDHIISLKHGGDNTIDNLAYACFYCNRHKGSDIGTQLEGQKDLIRFFNPRVDSWQEHFQHIGPEIFPISKKGEATVKILQLNHYQRIEERVLLIKVGRYP
jgi:hypothetical protein